MFQIEITNEHIEPFVFRHTKTSIYSNERRTYQCYASFTSTNLQYNDKVLRNIWA